MHTKCCSTSYYNNTFNHCFHKNCKTITDTMLDSSLFKIVVNENATVHNVLHIHCSRMSNEPLTVVFWCDAVFVFWWLLSVALRWTSFRRSRLRVCIVRSSPGAMLTCIGCIAGCGATTEQAEQNTLHYSHCFHTFVEDCEASWSTYTLALFTRTHKNKTDKFLWYLTLWRPLLPYEYSYKASCAVICTVWHLCTLGVKGLMSVIINQ